MRHHLAAQDHTPNLSSVERSGWHPPRGFWASALAIAGLAALFLLTRRHPGPALICFAALTWLALGATGWHVIPTAAAIVSLGVLALTAREGSGAGAGGQKGWWLLLVGLALLTLSLVLASPAAAPSPRQIGLYLLWATVQQVLLCRVVWPVARRGTRREGLAVVVAALLFGWAHLPNLELMVLTFVLGLGTLAHFRRYRALPPVIGFHFLAGLALVLSTPNALVYSTSVGPSFWS